MSHLLPRDLEEAVFRLVDGSYSQNPAARKREDDISTVLRLVWSVGIPDVVKGKQASFWCRIKTFNGTKEGVRLLQYGNAFIMPLSDTCDEAPENAVPVGDDGDYEWTGWWETSCDQCDTYWGFNGKVIAWIRLPECNTEPT